MKRRVRQKPEPTIALINIVFLMLVFFLVAGTLASPLDSDLKLVKTQDLAQSAPPDALVVHQNGAVTYKGEAVQNLASFVSGKEDAEGELTIRLVPDQNLPALELLNIAKDLRVAGAEQLVLVTQRALE